MFRPEASLDSSFSQLPPSTERVSMYGDLELATRVDDLKVYFLIQTPSSSAIPTRPSACRTGTVQHNAPTSRGSLNAPISTAHKGTTNAPTDGLIVFMPVVCTLVCFVRFRNPCMVGTASRTRARECRIGANAAPMRMRTSLCDGRRPD